MGERAAARNAEIWSAAGLEYRRRLEARRDEIRAALHAAEEAMQNFREREHIVDLSAQLKATVEQAALLEGMRLQKQRELRFVRHYASQGSEEAVRAEIDSQVTQATLHGLGKKPGGPLLEWERIPRLELEYSRLKRELDEKTASYELVVRQVEQLRAQETRPAGRAEVIEPATTPMPHTNPSGTLLVIAGALLGLLCGGFPVLRVQLFIGLRRRFGPLIATGASGWPGERLQELNRPEAKSPCQTSFSS
jgi:uncharacterized protein involved in exopolysaccharide biosynthesis